MSHLNHWMMGGFSLEHPQGVGIVGIVGTVGIVGIVGIEFCHPELRPPLCHFVKKKEKKKIDM